MSNERNEINELQLLAAGLTGNKQEEYNKLNDDMSKRLISWWDKEIFDDDVILEADPVLKEFARKLPNWNIDVCPTFAEWSKGVAAEYESGPDCFEMYGDVVFEDEEESSETGTVETCDSSESDDVSGTVETCENSEDEESEAERRWQSFQPAEADPYDAYVAEQWYANANTQAQKFLASGRFRAALFRRSPPQYQTYQQPKLPKKQAKRQSKANKGASENSSEKSGDSGSNGDDPDPHDKIIQDPAKNDTRILKRGDTFDDRIARKAVYALRNGIQHTAADYYISIAFNRMVEQIKARVAKFEYKLDYDVAAPLIHDAANSLLLMLAKSHDFAKTPNPNFAALISSNIAVPANLREVANRLYDDDDKNNKSKKRKQQNVDFLDVAAGLVRSGLLQEKPYRAEPQRGEDDESDPGGVDWLDSQKAIDNPLIVVLAEEMVGDGQIDADDLDDDVRLMVQDVREAALGIDENRVSGLSDVLDKVATQHESVIHERAAAIIAALTDLLPGFDTQQHRIDKLRTAARNRRGHFTPAQQSAARSLLEGIKAPV